MNNADNRRYIRSSMFLQDLSPIDIADPDAVKERGEWYLRYCVENDLAPGIAGLCLALGIDRRTFSGWTSGAHRMKTHTKIAARFKWLLESLLELKMLEGKICPTTGIFFLKQHHGYRDQYEVTPATADPVDTYGPDEIRRRYLLPD